jgi:hypothetical protein
MCDSISIHLVINMVFIFSQVPHVTANVIIDTKKAVASSSVPVHAHMEIRGELIATRKGGNGNRFPFQMIGEVDLRTNVFQVSLVRQDFHGRAKFVARLIVQVLSELDGVICGDLVLGQSAFGLICLTRSNINTSPALPAELAFDFYNFSSRIDRVLFSELHYHHVCDGLYRKWTGYFCIDTKMTPVQGMHLRVSVSQVSGSNGLLQRTKDSANAAAPKSVSIDTLGFVPTRGNTRDPLMYCHALVTVFCQDTGGVKCQYEFNNLSIGAIYSLRGPVRPMIQGTSSKHNVKLFLRCPEPNAFFSLLRTDETSYRPIFKDVKEKQQKQPQQPTRAKRVVAYTLPTNAVLSPHLRSQNISHPQLYTDPTQLRGSVWRFFPTTTSTVATAASTTTTTAK